MGGYIIAITPTAGWSWPALGPIILAAAAVKGFEALTENNEYGEITKRLKQRIREDNTIAIEVDSVVAEFLKDEVKRAETLMFRKDELFLEVIRDERGKLRVQVTGPAGMKRKELEEIAREFIAEVVQTLAQDKIARQMEQLGAEVIEEQVDDKGEVVLRMRRYQ